MPLSVWLHFLFSNITTAFSIYFKHRRRCQGPVVLKSHSKPRMPPQHPKADGSTAKVSLDKHRILLHYVAARPPRAR